MELGDKKSYAIKGFGATNLQFDSGSFIHIDEILYVPGLKKNLLSVAVLEDKGYNLTLQRERFLYGQQMDNWVQ